MKYQNIVDKIITESVENKSKMDSSKIYRLKWANGAKTSLVNHDEAVKLVNEAMNRKSWGWVTILNTETQKTQFVQEPISMINRGFLQLRGLNKNMLSEAKKFDLGWGHLGNGISVWNRAKEERGDYQKVAHIDSKRNIKYYITNLPTDIKKQIEKIAKGKNPSVSTSQPDIKVFDENKKPEVHTVTYDLSNKSDKDLIKDIGKYNNKEGNEVIFRDGTHTIKFKYKNGKWIRENKLNEYYSIEYYDKQGGHGDVGQDNNFDMAYKKAINLYKREKSAGELGKSTGYIGVSGDGDDFAIIYVDKDYLSVNNANVFSDKTAYNNWLAVAKKVLQTGKPMKGTYIGRK